MKYVAEQDRKFTDMGGVKTYHTIYPVVCRQEAAEWGPVIRFDNKVLLPGKQEVQNFIGSPIQIIRVAINGTTDYFDSWGYRTVLGEQDTLLVNSGDEALQSVLHNADEFTENELLEIWLLSDQQNKDYQFHSGMADRERDRFYTLISTGRGENNDQQEKWLRAGTFNAGATYQLNPAGHTFILFVFNGELSANGQPLAYRDTVIFTGESQIQLDFKKTTDLFVMEMEIKEARP